MSNHFHIVAFINADKSKGWTDSEVIDRWHQLFKGTLQNQRFVAGEQQSKSAMQLLAYQAQNGVRGSLISAGLCAH